MTKPNTTASAAWTALVPEDQWKIYREAIRAARKARARFVLGGAFGLAGYTGRWRNTKDVDLFVLPEEKDQVIDALTKAGFEDYFSHCAYDRGWIYRAVKDGVIADTIWQTPNRRSKVDEEWFRRGRTVQLRGEELHLIPAEELLAIKLYVIQRDRCDWPDLINLLHCAADQLDWDHVLNRLGAERALLAGLLHVFNWISPEGALRLPEKVRREFCLPQPNSEDLALPSDYRVKLIDTRPWFAAFQPEDKPMIM